MKKEEKAPSSGVYKKDEWDQKYDESDYGWMHDMNDVNDEHEEPAWRLGEEEQEKEPDYAWRLGEEDEVEEPDHAWRLGEDEAWD